MKLRSDSALPGSRETPSSELLALSKGLSSTPVILKPRPSLRGVPIVPYSSDRWRWAGACEPAASDVYVTPAGGCDDVYLR